MTTNESTNQEREDWEEVKRQLGDENFKVFVGSDAEKLTAELDEKKSNPVQLPPLPEGILPWNEDEEKFYKYPVDILGPSVDKKLRFKLFNLWSLWGSYRNNQAMIDILNQIPEDKTSQEFVLKCSLVLLIDKLGKILSSDTNLLEELTDKGRFSGESSFSSNKQ
jgi:hypothetical protein